MRKLLGDLRLQQEALISGNVHATVLQRLRATPSLGRPWPKPDACEYIFRTQAIRPQTPNSLATAQRMYVAQQGDQFRLAIALGVDYEA